MAGKREIFMSASEDRLYGLIESRLRPGADREKIDQRIWDLFGEEWAVMFTDVSGFSRNVAKFGIIHFLQTIYEAERILVPVIEDFDGILLKTEGDSFLVIFRNVGKAIQSSIAMQSALAQENHSKAPEDAVLLCVGLGFGRVLKIGDSNVFGSEVNAASKLGEDIAKSGEILVTAAVREAASDYKFEQLDEIPAGTTSAWRLLYDAGSPSAGSLPKLNFLNPA